MWNHVIQLWTRLHVTSTGKCHMPVSSKATTILNRLIKFKQMQYKLYSVYIEVKMFQESPLMDIITWSRGLRLESVIYITCPHGLPVESVVCITRSYNLQLKSYLYYFHCTGITGDRYLVIVNSYRKYLLTDTSGNYQTISLKHCKLSAVLPGNTNNILTYFNNFD